MCRSVHPLFKVGKETYIEALRTCFAERIRAMQFAACVLPDIRASFLGNVCTLEGMGISMIFYEDACKKMDILNLCKGYGGFL